MLLLLLGVALAATSVCAEQGHQQPQDEQVFQLDDELFSDLQPFAREKPLAPAPTKQPEEADGESPGSTSEEDLDLLRYVGGEDLGLARDRGPLEKVARTMQQVKKRLALADTAMKTQQLQSRIVQDLDELLAQLQKQSPPRDGSSPQRSKPPSAGSEPSSQQQGPAKATSNDPASQSGNRLAQVAPVSTTQAERDRLLEKAWGNLPAAVRQQLQSARPETFLPKYSRLIEDYFKRLAEDPDQEYR